MKCKVVEIRWHDTTPIFSADFHSAVPEQHKKVAHPYLKTSGGVGVDTSEDAQPANSTKEGDEDKMWRLATCGGDKNIRLWLVHPHPPPTPAPLTLVPSTSKLPAAPAKPVDTGPTVEYLATLKQHTGVVNVVRFCPVGDMLASAGDDGNIVFWIPGESTGTFGESAEDLQYEKERWRVKSMCRTKTGQEIYDLAFSPDGKRILTGSVDHTANIYDVASGQLIATIADHTNYVQGVSWDPMNRFIATQSSDRSMHIYSLTETANGGLVTHAIGKNSRMPVDYQSGGTWQLPTPAATPSEERSRSMSVKGKEAESRPPPHRRSNSHVSDSGHSEASSVSLSHPPVRPTLSSMGTSTSAISLDDAEETTMDPPATRPARPASRRSSTSSSHPSQSPRLGAAHSPLPVRDPSPAPLPAVRVPLSPTIGPQGPAPSGKVETMKLYTDANSTPFFRRLSWSTDGSLLLTPAGLFEDPYASLNDVAPTATSSKPTDGQKPRKNATPAGLGGKGKDQDTKAAKPTVYIYSRSNIGRPPIAHLPGHKTTSIAIRFCPVLWELRQLPAEKEGDDDVMVIDLAANTNDTKLATAEPASSTKVENEKPHSLFDLPYRMIYAVATLDAVFLYDTQQAGPICMFANLHYAPFTDSTWSPDGQTLVLSAQDGYCTVVAFEPGELGTPYKATVSELSQPPSIPSIATTPSLSASGQMEPQPTITPQLTIAAAFANIASASTTASTSTSVGPSAKRTGEQATVESNGEPAPKKVKKKAALTFLGPLGGS